jgi:hypothetical protein
MIFLLQLAVVEVAVLLPSETPSQLNILFLTALHS